MSNRSNSDLLTFMTFDLARPPQSLVMALNVQKVKEVVEAEPLSPIPEGDHGMLGIYDLRGIPVPVIDIERFYFKREVQSLSPENKRFIICELQKDLIAFPVCETGRIINCKPADFLPPPPATPYVVGLIRKSKSYIPVLHLDMIMDLVRSTKNDEFVPTLMSKSQYTGKNVLLVDDSNVILKKTKQIFEKIGFHCTTALNGEEAMARMEETSTPLDLIFTDIEMPILDGITMARKIKTNPKWRQIPIIFNTALSNPALIYDVGQEKLGSYIVKFDEAAIIHEVERIVSNS